MRIRSALGIVWFVYLSNCMQSLAQHVYELPNCYCVDTYKTDFAPGDELVRSERSFFKKLFKNWGRWGLDDCTQCCQNNAGYNGGAAGNGDNVNGNGYYQEEEQYDNGYEPLFAPPDIPAGHHGHIYLPLPHPHRVMTHLHHYFNRPFRRGYGGKVGPPSSYPPKESYVEEKPKESYVEEKPKESYIEDKPKESYVEELPQKEETIDAYQEPAPVEESTPAYTEAPAYVSEEKYDKKDEYVDKSEDHKKYEKEEKPAPVTQQVIQPIVPIIAQPVYIYPQQYYSPPGVQPIPYGQQYVYPTPPSPSYPVSPVQYNPPAYSPPEPTYTQASPAVTPVQYNSPQALIYPSPAPLSYSHPAPTYSQVLPPQPQSQPQPQQISTYTPLASLAYPPLPLAPLPEPSLPCPFSNPSDCAYLKKTYSTSLTYLLPQSPSPPSSYSNTLTVPCYENDQPMKSCPELFSTYQMSLQAAAAPVSQPY